MTRIVNVLNDTLRGLIETDERVHVFGESIEAPYGGAFKVTGNLSATFPGRVFDTPISEAGITGMATGMALRGLRPIVEVMFGDFISLCLDQVLNGMTKFRVMFGRNVAVPVVLRTPMGGGRGYGATHSQTIEKLFVGIPHLNVVAPSPVHDVGNLLRSAVISDDGPTLFIEHKLLYAQRVWDDAAHAENGSFASTTDDLYPTVTVRPKSDDGDDPADVSIVTYGGMVPIVVEATQRLREADILCEIVVPSRIAPLDAAPIVESVARTGCAVIVEEGTRSHGWGAEVACRIHECDGTADASTVRVGARDHALPSAKRLESEFLPDVGDVEAAILELV